VRWRGYHHQIQGPLYLGLNSASVENKARLGLGLGFKPLSAPVCSCLLPSVVSALSASVGVAVSLLPLRRRIAAAMLLYQHHRLPCVSSLPVSGSTLRLLLLLTLLGGRLELGRFMPLIVLRGDVPCVFHNCFPCCVAGICAFMLSSSMMHLEVFSRRPSLPPQCMAGRLQHHTMRHLIGCPRVPPPRHRASSNQGLAEAITATVSWGLTDRGCVPGRGF
jgi:hypothetical protein